MDLTLTIKLADWSARSRSRCMSSGLLRQPMPIVVHPPHLSLSSLFRMGTMRIGRVYIEEKKRLAICHAKRSQEEDGDRFDAITEWLRRFGVGGGQQALGRKETGVGESDGEEAANSNTGGSMVTEIEDYFSNRTPTDHHKDHPTNLSKSDRLSDWARSGAADKDWDEWETSPAVADVEDVEDAAELREQVIERRRARRGRRTTVRDEYLRPIVDVTGIYNRLAISEKEAEERVFIEAITNQYESREALKYAGILFIIPFSVAFVVSNLVAKPLWAYAEKINPEAFALRDEQKVEGAEAMHREEIRLRLETSIGQAPPLTEQEMFEHLHEEAVAFAEEMKEYNKRSLLNVVSDSSAGIALFVLLLQDTSPRAILFRTIGRVFTGLSDTAKAFIIILVTDTLLGYHSEEGWTAALTLVGHHYGVPAHKEGLQLFVATVPVILDSLFKYWIFVGLNKIDPAAAVTLRQMDRH